MAVSTGRLHSTEEAFLLPTLYPQVCIPAPPRFLSLLLSWWKVLRSNPSSAKQWISQLQLALTSRAKYHKKVAVRTVTSCMTGQEYYARTKLFPSELTLSQRALTVRIAGQKQFRTEISSKLAHLSVPAVNNAP